MTASGHDGGGWLKAISERLQRLHCNWRRWRTRHDEPPAFLDRWGCPYWLYVENEGSTSTWRLLAAGPRVVGEVGLRQDGDSLHLADIRIFKVEDRRRGLGTILLQRVIEYAGEQRIRTVTGKAVAEDKKHQEQLLAWYRRHGFSVTTARDKTGETVQWIRLELEAQSSHHLNAFGPDMQNRGSN